jgi:DNA-binding Xre family transcriptional regulator
LQEAGYEPRSIRSIQHRAYAFETVRSGRFQEGRQLPYASEQVVEVYKVLSDEKVSKHEEIAACIRELYNPNEETEVELTNLNPNNTIGYQCAVDTKKTFPVMLQRLLDLKGIKRHQDLCDKLGMSINTFNAIIRGKYTTVQKDSVLQICIGLELCTMQVEELLDSAGYTLSYGKMKDVVIRACIQNRQYNPIAINRELRDHGVKDEDLLYSKKHPFHRPQ